MEFRKNHKLKKIFLVCTPIFFTMPFAYSQHVSLALQSVGFVSRCVGQLVSDPKNFLYAASVFESCARIADRHHRAHILYANKNRPGELIGKINALHDLESTLKEFNKSSILKLTTAHILLLQNINPYNPLSIKPVLAAFDEHIKTSLSTSAICNDPIATTVPLYNGRTQTTFSFNAPLYNENFNTLNPTTSFSTSLKKSNGSTLTTFCFNSLQGNTHTDAFVTATNHTSNSQSITSTHNFSSGINEFSSARVASDIYNASYKQTQPLIKLQINSENFFDGQGFKDQMEQAYQRDFRK